MRWFWPLLLSSCLLACGGEDITPQDAEAAPSDVVDAPPSVADTSTGTPDTPQPPPDTSLLQDTSPDGDTPPAEVSPPLEDSGDLKDLGPVDAEPSPGPGDVADTLDTWDIQPLDVLEPGLEPVPEGASPGRAPMRRLTRHELDNTVRHLTGVEGVAHITLPPDPETQGFDNHVDAQPVSPNFVEALMLMAEQVAAAADLTTLLPCDPESLGEGACGHAFITQFGRVAMRRPLTEAQQLRFETLFDTALTDWGFEEATRLGLTAMLMSPHFLYRVELGMPETEIDGVVRPTPHEMAARLSYLLYESAPDAELAAAADAGELVSSVAVLEQAQRMLDTLEAAQMLDHFHRQWLLLDRLLFMAPVSEKFASFRTETRLFVQRTLLEGEGSFQALVTGTDTAIDDVLKVAYTEPDMGAFVSSWVPDSSQFRWATVDPERRAGVLTQPSVLSVHAVGPSATKTLIRRGVFTLDRLLCTPLPPPPDTVPELPLDEDTELSPLELLAQHSGDPACAGCHDLIDPVGIAFEHYTAQGTWRDVYHDDTPVNAATELVGTPLDGAYADAVDLAHALGDSEEAQTCYARHWYRFAHGRGVEQDDAESFDDVLTAFLAEGGDVRTLVKALVTTDAFLYRPLTPPSDEVTP